MFGVRRGRRGTRELVDDPRWRGEYLRTSVTENSDTTATPAAATIIGTLRQAGKLAATPRQATTATYRHRVQLLA